MLHVVFLPGMMSDSRLWAPQTSALAGEYETRVCYFPHHNTITKMAEEVLQTSPDRFAVIGTSMGGYVALEIARLAPNRISHLGLFNTNPYADSPERQLSRQQEINAGETAFLAQRHNIEHANFHLGTVSKNNPDIIKTLRDQALDLGYATQINHHTACMNRTDKLSLIGELSMPISVLGGNQDVVTPPRGQIEIALAARNARLVILRDCGHIATLEQPNDVTFEIRKLLSIGS